MFKGLGDFANIMGKMKDLQENATKMREEIEKKIVEADAGAGMVSVTLTGAGNFTAIKIDKSIVNPDDTEMLEDLVLSAVNEGIKKSKELLKEELTKITGGMPIPPNFNF